jgi:hypothetical protein
LPSLAGPASVLDRNNEIATGRISVSRILCQGALEHRIDRPFEGRIQSMRGQGIFLDDFERQRRDGIAGEGLLAG